jgi:parvulin-like peptidyl-prolyl isomerase
MTGMDIGSILAGLALLVLVAAFVGRPLFERSGIRVADEDRELSSLLAERDRILSLLQELDMDRAMNKILEEDYQAQRADLLKEGAAILRKIDGLQPAGTVAEEESDLEREIELEVARIRQAETRVDTPFCPACGAEVSPDDRFCMQCGEPLIEGADA